MSPQATMLPSARLTDKRAVCPSCGWSTGRVGAGKSHFPHIVTVNLCWSRGKMAFSLYSFSSQWGRPLSTAFREDARGMEPVRMEHYICSSPPMSRPVPGRLACNPPRPHFPHSPRPEPSCISHGTRTQPKLRVGPEPLGWDSNPPSFH